MANNIILRILLLGTPAVYHGDQPLYIQRRLLRWTLYYLACQKEMVGRSDLILLFWPDESEEKARRRLRETLSKLKKQLPDPNLIVTEHDRVGLDLNRVYSDVLDFQSLFSQTARVCTQTPVSSPLTEAVHQKVVRAVRLWRSGRFAAGMPLPEGEGLTNWLLNTAQQCETQRQRLIERLTDHDIASGDVDGAIQWLRSALEGDEINESHHYRLLSLLHKHGRYSEALNYCSFLAELFRREGYSELPPSLLGLSKKIREPASHPNAASERPSWPSLANMQVPFVGREQILQELQFAVRRGNPVIIFGEGGSGKSRLVRELFFSLKPAPRLLLASARMMENSLPLQPIIDMLRHDIQAEEWSQMEDIWVATLSLLLPEMSIYRPDIRAPQITPNQEHNLIFEALRYLLSFISKKQPFLLFLDNAHWSDGTTLEALAYLANRGVFGENGALILAARTEIANPHLESFLNQPPGGFSVQQMSLAPLQPKDIAMMTRYVLGDKCSQEIIQRLGRETGGNPLFLLETLRVMLDYSLDSQLPVDVKHLPIAGSIHTLVRERLQSLSPNDLQTLSLAAVIGSEFSIDLLEATCMLPPEQVVQSLESLAQLNLIKASTQDRPSSEYIFVHEKIREVILLDLSPARKRLLHLRVARVLEQNQDGESAEIEAVLADHYEEAGELSAAFRHWIKAALYARRLYAQAEVFAAYDRAEQILQRLGAQASNQLIYDLYRQWGQFAFEIGNLQVMERVYQTLLQFGLRRQSQFLVGSAYNGLAQIHELTLNPIMGLETLEKALSYLDQSENLYEQIEALNRQGMFRLLLKQYAESRRSFEKVIELSSQSQDPELVSPRANARLMLSLLHGISGWPFQAIQMAEMSYRDASLLLSQSGMIRASSMAARFMNLSGLYHESLKMARSAMEMAEATYLPHLLGEALNAAGEACFALGDLDSCWQYAQKVLQIAQERDAGFLKVGAYGLLGKLYLFLGNEEKAAQMFQAGSQDGAVNFQAAQNLAFLGWTEAARGNFSTAMDKIERALQAVHQDETFLIKITAQLAKASLLIETRQSSEAMRLLEFISVEADRRCLPEFQIFSSYLHSKHSLREKQYEAALRTARLGAAKAKAISNLPLEIETCVFWQQAADILHSPDRFIASERLQQAAQVIIQHTKTPELRDLFHEREKAWTYLPESN
ncbi:MAG: AAA family ATPase [Chloroflexi bacterium]|nr:AAA family ATPase [Chloroflexota bacterium]